MTYEEALQFIEKCNTTLRYVKDKEQWPKYNQAMKILKEKK